ncbi:hypothetical protein D3C73_1228270 [compost metagenome]
MNHPLELVLSKQLRHALAIGQIQLNKLEGGFIRQQIEASHFQAHIIIIIQVVDTDNLMPSGQQTLSGVITNKPCRACNQEFHIYPLNNRLNGRTATNRIIGKASTFQTFRIKQVTTIKDHRLL